MLITSHIASILLLAKIFDFNQQELLVAFLGGVMVDIDHLFVNKKWIKDIKDFVKEKKITYGINQHSWLQELLFGSFFGILTGLIIEKYTTNTSWYIFPLGLWTHILLDSIMRNRHWPLAPFSKWSYVGIFRSGSLVEFTTSVILIITLLIWL